MFSGDFRQILTVVPRGTKSDQINACIKSSFLWDYVRTLGLTANMRLRLGDNTHIAQFSRALLDIGNEHISNDDSEVHIGPLFATNVK